MVHIKEDNALFNVVVDNVGVHSTTLSKWFIRLHISWYIVKNDQLRYFLGTGCHGQLKDMRAELLAFFKDL